MKKQLSSLILAFSLCLCLLPASASAVTSSNLLVNPSFEDGLNGWVCPDGKWGTVEYESGTSPRTAVPSPGPPGPARRTPVSIRTCLSPAIKPVTR